MLSFETAAALPGLGSNLGAKCLRCLQRHSLTQAAAALHPPRSPEFPFCCHWAFRSVEAFFFAICWRTLKCQARGRFPSLIPFQPCGGGGEGKGQL